MPPLMQWIPTIRRSALTEWLLPLGAVVTALWLADVCASDGRSAAAQMQSAHDGRAVWRDFPGFEAVLNANRDGQTFAGRLVVTPSGSIELRMSGSANAEWLEKALDSLIGHRLADSDPIRNVEYADDNAAHPFGRLIRSLDREDASLWRVRGDVLTEVHRFNDKTHFVISVSDVARTPEGKHLPQDFAVETWDRATGRLIKSRQVHTEWTRVENFDLPTRWWAVVNSDGEGRSVESFELSAHRLLPKAAAAAGATSP
ncbi:MAG: DUF3386 family protein [Planctomycetaceae bacterium]|nr:DUF3386 family protein [Planctomycetaceae bacterium]